MEKEQGKYEWSGYLALAKMVQDVGLKLRVSLCFHASKELQITLPQWISKIGEVKPDIYFTDKVGHRYRECLTFAIDELPVLDGRSSMHVYNEFLKSFKSSFSEYIGTTITDISVGLGPNGELRYPSCPAKLGEELGAGEFQCYDKYMRHHLSLHARATGNSDWGLNGPHNAPSCHESPVFNAFFRENDGSWETPYGDFLPFVVLRPTYITWLPSSIARLFNFQ